MSILSKVRSWFRPSDPPKDEADAEEIRNQRASDETRYRNDTIRVSQGGAYLPAGESSSVPPTPDVTDPR